MAILSSNAFLLLGAGASADAGVPMAVQFVGRIRAHLAKLPTPSASVILPAFDEVCGYIKSSTGREPGLEPFFEAIDDCLDAHYFGTPAPNLLKPSRALERIHYETKRVIQEACEVRENARTAYLEPLLRALRPLAPFPIASFNYDSVIEAECDRVGMRYAESVLHENTDGCEIELIKVHGSITWLPEPKGRSLKRSRRYGSAIMRQFGELRSAVLETPMIYPSRRKMPVHEPFMRNAVRLQELLRTKKACVVVGYSFPDLHVRAWLDAALEANPELRVYLVGPHPEDQALDNLALNLPRHRWRERLRLVKMGFRDAIQVGLEECLDKAPHFGPGFSYPKSLSRASPATEFCFEGRPSGIAASPDGKALYVTEGSKGALWRVDLVARARSLVARRLKDPRGVAVHPDGDLLVVQNRLLRTHFVPTAGAGTVLKISGDGLRRRTLTRFSFSELLRLARLLRRGTPWSDARQAFRSVLSWPTDVACADNGFVFATEARSLVHIREGAEPERICEPPLAFNLHSLDIAPDGALIGLEQGIGQAFSWGRVLRFEISPDGVRFSYGPGGEGRSRLMGICFVPPFDCVVVTKTVSWPHGGLLVLDYPALTERTFVNGFDFPQQVEYVPHRNLLAIGNPEGVELVSLDLISHKG